VSKRGGTFIGNKWYNRVVMKGIRREKKEGK
jgi:hypothetical protein